jgi:TatD DNase family protein
MPHKCNFVKTNIKPMLVNLHTHHLKTEIDVRSIENIIVDIEFVDNIENYGLDPSKYYSAGIHPWYIQENRYEEQLYILDKLANNPQIKAIGEVGLDKVRGANFELQEKVFLSTIRTAERVGKPIIIHCVKSFSELLSIQKLVKPKVPLIIHGFNKNIELALDLISKGFYLSFGVDLLKNHALEEVLKNNPLEQLFLETDDKDVQISAVYTKAAEILKMDIAELEEVIFENYIVVFK